MSEPAVAVVPLDTFRPQAENANRHTPRGHAALGDSIQRDGWIGAQTAAADGEIFDGSDRQEVGVATGFAEALVVHTTGDKPVIIVRDDIPTATDPRAQRLAVAANRVASLNLDWDTDVLSAYADAGVDLGLFWREDELAALVPAVLPEPGGGGDEFDATPAEGPSRTALGELWAIGPHRLLVGDSTDAAQVARLMGGQRAAAVVTDPPYGIDAVGSDGRIGLAKAFGRIVGDMQPFEPRHLFTLADNLVLWGANHYADKLPPSPCWLVWDKRDGDRHNDFADCELAWCSGTGVVRIFSHLWMGAARASERNIPREHATQKPLVVMEWALRERTAPGDLVVDPYFGSGTTLIAAHRTGRICYGCELEPKYADVVLRRAEAEQIGPITRLEP